MLGARFSQSPRGSGGQGPLETGAGDDTSVPILRYEIQARPSDDSVLGAIASAPAVVSRHPAQACQRRDRLMSAGGCVQAALSAAFDVDLRRLQLHQRRQHGAHRRVAPARLP